MEKKSFHSAPARLAVAPSPDRRKKIKPKRSERWSAFAEPGLATMDHGSHNNPSLNIWLLLEGLLRRIMPTKNYLAIAATES